jgi:hypothetical protein
VNFTVVLQWLAARGSRDQGSQLNVEARDCYRHGLGLWRRIADQKMAARTLARTAEDPRTLSSCPAYATMVLRARDPVERLANLDEAITLARTVGWYREAL